ncbi:MAG: cytochrome b/b6 domain-containing protein [Pseudomonadota bacterium]
MKGTPRILVWDWPLRLFHVGLALAFGGAYLLGDSERWRNVHVALGYAALALLGFRLLWGVAGTRHARFASFLYTPRQAYTYLVGLVRGRSRHYTGHNPAGSWAVYAMLLLGLATGFSGWMRYEELGGDRLEALHELFANAWLGLVGLHVVAVIASSVLHRENLVLAMITGYKRGPAAESAGRAHAWLGLALVAAIAAVVALALAAPAGTVDASAAAVASRAAIDQD